MKRAKKSKPDIRKKIEISPKQLEKIKQEISAEAVTKTGMLYLVALSEMGWDEEQIVELFTTIERYTGYVDNKIVKLKEVQEIIERRTGIKIKGGW